MLDMIPLPEALCAELVKILGPSGLLRGADVQARGAGFIRPGECIRASAIALPRSTEDVSRVMAACHRTDVPVVPMSGLTGMADGALSGPGEIALSLEKLNRIEALDPVQGTITLQAGVPLQVAQERAAAHGLLLANDLAARGSALIGGVIATNAGGLKAVRYGVARDQVLGLEVVLADGRIVDSLTSTVKNNTGIDLKHLFIGSEGTLGIITRAVLRLRPEMRFPRTAMIGCDSVDEAARLLAFVQQGLEGALSSFEVMWDDFVSFVTAPGRVRLPLDQVPKITVLIEADYGSEASAAQFDRVMESAFETGLIADAVIAHSETQRRALWAVRESNEHLEALQPQFRYDVSVPLALIGDYVAEVWAALDAANPGGARFTFAHVGDSNVHFVAIPASPAFDHAACDAIVYGPLRAFRGAVSAEHGVGLAKKGALHHSRDETELAVMRAIKAALDPKTILNPGKVFDMPGARGAAAGEH